MKELFDYLAQFDQIPVPLKKRLIRISEPISCKKNAVLVREGSYNQHLYFIIRGMFRGYYLDKKGRDISAWFMGEGELVAAMQSYVFKIPSAETIHAIEPCDIIRLSYVDIDQVYEDFPRFERIGRLITQRYNFHWFNHAKELKVGTAEDRYRSLLQYQPEIIQRVPKKYIATYLKTTPAHLSRIRV